MKPGDKELLEQIAAAPKPSDLTRWRVHLTRDHDCRYVRADMSLEAFHATLEHREHPAHNKPE